MRLFAYATRASKPRIGWTLLEFCMLTGPITLLILDGFGDGPRNAFDATYVASMPRFNELRKAYATTQLQTSGEAVGLPEGQFGNSEVGHMNLGAGRVVWQELTRIDAAIRRGTFRENPTMGALLADLKATGKDRKSVV